MEVAIISKNRVDLKIICLCRYTCPAFALPLQEPFSGAVMSFHSPVMASFLLLVLCCIPSVEMVAR